MSHPRDRRCQNGVREAILRAMRIFMQGFVLASLTGAALLACGTAGSDGRFADAGILPIQGDGAAGRGDGSTLGSSDAGDEDTACKKMDLVFVVDDSGSMEEEQANLAANFPKFIDVLNKFKTKNGAPIDYRIAITTTGVDLTISQEIFGIVVPSQTQKGDNGKFRSNSSMSRSWLERDDANMAATFSSIAAVGTNGPGWEMPLQAGRLALRERLSDSNKGFVRDDALLGMIYLTDEEDCSVGTSSAKLGGTQTCAEISEDPANFIKYFDDLKKGHERWATAVIAGPSECKSAFGDANEAKRLKTFVAKVGKTGVFSSICDGDLSGALTKALQTFDAACKNFAPPR